MYPEEDSCHTLILFHILLSYMGYTSGIISALSRATYPHSGATVGMVPTLAGKCKGMGWYSADESGDITRMWSSVSSSLHCVLLELLSDGIDLFSGSS